MKLTQKKWRSRLPKMKSANALSFDVLSNSALFSGFVWIRKLAVSTNWPTVALKPDRNALKGKFPAITQYTNCNTPTTTKNAMKQSRSLTRCGVFCTYLSHTPCTISCAVLAFGCFEEVEERAGVDAAEEVVCEAAWAEAGVAAGVEGPRCLGGMAGILVLALTSDRGYRGYEEGN